MYNVSYSKQYSMTKKSLSARLTRGNLGYLCRCPKKWFYFIYTTIIRLIEIAVNIFDMPVWSHIKRLISPSILLQGFPCLNDINWMAPGGLEILDWHFSNYLIIGCGMISPQLNVAGSYWWWANIRSVNDLVPSGNVINVDPDLCRQMAPLCYNELSYA